MSKAARVAILAMVTFGVWIYLLMRLTAEFGFVGLAVVMTIPVGVGVYIPMKLFSEDEDG